MGNHEPRKYLKKKYKKFSCTCTEFRKYVYICMLIYHTYNDTEIPNSYSIGLVGLSGSDFVLKIRFCERKLQGTGITLP